MSTDRPKRQMTEEQLQRLAAARQKALAVRQEKSKKLNEIKALEKVAKDKELDDKLAEVQAKVAPPTPPAQEPIIQSKFIAKNKSKRSNVIKQIVEEESSESSGSESESDEDVTDPIKTLYKNKYKHKYAQKYKHKTITHLTKGVAQNQLRKKIDEEMVRMAQFNLFGGQ